MRVTVLGVVVIAGLFAMAAQASTITEQLGNCRKITANVARLACFDQLANQVAAVATAAADSDSLTTAKPRDVEMFGAKQLKKSPPETESRPQVIFTVKTFKYDPYGKLRFTFENGQQWQQTDSHPFKVKVGESLLLQKGVLDAVYLKKNQAGAKRKIRVKRLK
ncbi:hypothetical protein SAMN05216262_10937 [Colwellia chukchiensis]|uniref:Uncharacterized protein n=1 Tax=Colwellia chukchiensis TaxID=641665 RepID=A0A1H7PA80_9GAMM|nr:hypothetical protein [Colwellia chukchiensis]SEL32165.1 hypothetical protein SAMN05216262_10937 [Colwellia chukchiensis]